MSMKNTPMMQKVLVKDMVNKNNYMIKSMMQEENVKMQMDNMKHILGGRDMTMTHNESGNKMQHSEEGGKLYSGSMTKAIDHKTFYKK